MAAEILCPATGDPCPHEKCTDETQQCVSAVDAIIDKVNRMKKAGIADPGSYWEFTGQATLEASIILSIPSKQIKDLVIKRSHGEK